MDRETRRRWRRAARGFGLAGLAALAALVPAGARASDADPAPAEPAADPAPAPETVRPGAVVHLEFTLRSADGALLDGNRDRSPLVFAVGAGEVIPGLERALLGMTVGETRRITVEPEEAYGPRDPTAIAEVPRDRLPAEARVVGARVRARTRSGREVWARVREIGDATAVLDLNHPLAGQTLVFEVRVILVEPP